MISDLWVLTLFVLHVFHLIEEVLKFFWKLIFVFHQLMTFDHTKNLLKGRVINITFAHSVPSLEQ